MEFGLAGREIPNTGEKNMNGNWKDHAIAKQALKNRGFPDLAEIPEVVLAVQDAAKELNERTKDDIARSRKILDGNGKRPVG